MTMLEAAEILITRLVLCSVRPFGDRSRRDLMQRRRWRESMMIVVLLSGIVLAACSASSEPRQPITTYHSDDVRSGFMPDSSLTPSQAAALHQKWAIPASKAISAQAVVAGSTVYWGDWSGHEHATTMSGKQLWSTFVGLAPKPPGCPFNLGTMGVTSTATVGQVQGRTMVWVGGGGGDLYGLDATTGAVVWRTNLGAPPENTLWSSPAFFDGSIYEGVASWNDCPGVVYGKLYRVSAANGKVQRVFSPEQGHCVGGGIWSSPTIDVSHNALFVTTGNDECHSSVQNSIFKLDATTLRVESQWQSPGNPLVSDADFGATPTLFTAAFHGVTRQLVGGETKSGVYYAFDRYALGRGPVWSHVVQDDATLTSSACEDLNTISSSSWAGPGSAAHRRRSRRAGLDLHRHAVRIEPHDWSDAVAGGPPGPRSRCGEPGPRPRCGGCLVVPGRPLELHRSTAVHVCRAPDRGSGARRFWRAPLVLGAPDVRRELDLRRQPGRQPPSIQPLTCSPGRDGTLPIAQCTTSAADTAEWGHGGERRDTVRSLGRRRGSGG